MIVADLGFGEMSNKLNAHNNIFCRLDGLTPAARDRYRFKALEHLGLLGMDTIPVFDEATQTAARTLKAPIGIVGFTINDQFVLKSTVGLSNIGLMNQLTVSRNIPRSEAFSSYVVDSQQPLVIQDAALDSVFSQSILFQHYGIRAYLGVPLLTSEGLCVGALTVMDLEPREFTSQDVELLALTARWCMSEFERNRLQLEQQNSAAPKSNVLPNRLSDGTTAHQLSKKPLSPSFSNQESDLEALSGAEMLKVKLLTQLTEELRTPLTSVMGMARVLEREVYGPLSDKQKEYLDIIHNSGQHLLSLVEEIVNLSVFDKQGSNLLLSPVDIEMLAQQAINHLFHVAKQQRQQLRLSVEPGHRIWFLDKEKIRQALYYLVFTVIHSAEPGSEVQLHISRKETELNIGVWVSHPWLGDGLPQVEMYAPALSLDLAPDWNVSEENSTAETLKPLLSNQILSDSSLSVLEKVEQLKQKTENESYRELLGLVLSCHLAEMHGGKIMIQGSLQSGYRYVLKLPKIEGNEG